jgi:hypothetical protein
MTSFTRYIGEDIFYLDNNPILKGNLDPINEENLIKAEPKDLLLNKTYLLLNNETNEKTIAEFINIEIIDDEYEDRIEFQYIFLDKLGKLVIDGYNFEDENSEIYNFNYNPFYENVIFADEFCVYIPKSKELISKMLNKIFLPEIVCIIIEYL